MSKEKIVSYKSNSKRLLPKYELKNFLYFCSCNQNLDHIFAHVTQNMDHDFSCQLDKIWAILQYLENKTKNMLKKFAKYKNTDMSKNYALPPCTLHNCKELTGK